MGRRRGNTRAAALRQAQQAQAERAVREEKIQTALADYFEAAAAAERIRAEARRRADGTIEAGEQAAAEPEAAARDAVRQLRDLTGSNIEVAALCGLTVSAVRDILSAGPGERAGGHE